MPVVTALCMAGGCTIPIMDGSHSEAGNPVFDAYVGASGPQAVARSCVSCHVNNGRDLPPEVGQPLSRAVIKGCVGLAGNPRTRIWEIPSNPWENQSLPVTRWFG